MRDHSVAMASGQRCGLPLGVCISTVLVLLLACASDPPPDEGDEREAGNPYEAPSPRTRLTLEELPPMPDYPDGEAGRLVAISAGDFPVDGRWGMEAGICEPTGTVEFYTDDPNQGVAIVLQFPDSALDGTYTVIPSDSASEEERVARIGVQVFHGSDAYGLSAINGELEILVDGRNLSGRFASTIEEVQSAVLTRFVGVFEGIRLEDLSPEYCLTLADSLRARSLDSDTLPDSIPTEEGTG